MLFLSCTSMVCSRWWTAMTTEQHMWLLPSIFLFYVTHFSDFIVYVSVLIAKLPVWTLECILVHSEFLCAYALKDAGHCQTEWVVVMQNVWVLSTCCTCRHLLVEEEMVRSICSRFWSLVNLELAKRASLSAMYTSSSRNIIGQQYPLILYAAM